MYQHPFSLNSLTLYLHCISHVTVGGKLTMLLNSGNDVLHTMHEYHADNDRLTALPCTLVLIMKPTCCEEMTYCN